MEAAASTNRCGAEAASTKTATAVETAAATTVETSAAAKAAAGRGDIRRQQANRGSCQ